MAGGRDVDVVDPMFLHSSDYLVLLLCQASVLHLVKELLGDTRGALSISGVGLGNCIKPFSESKLSQASQARRDNRGALQQLQSI